MTKLESAIKWMEDLASDNRHGYDQIYRWGEKGDYDCSSAVITAFEQAGIKLKSYGATFTGDMKGPLEKCGFKNITYGYGVNKVTGAGLKRGDVLLNTTKHVALYLGNGLEVEASINEKGRATGGTPGDQTGQEILIRKYRNYPWTDIYRYEESSAPVSTKAGTYTIKKWTVKTVRKGDTGNEVKFLQQLLIACGFSCGVYGADGDFGNDTEIAVCNYQRSKRLDVDGIVGIDTWTSLLNKF